MIRTVATRAIRIPGILFAVALAVSCAASTAGQHMPARSLDRFEAVIAHAPDVATDVERARQVLLAYRTLVQPLVANGPRLSESATQRMFGTVYAAYFYTLSDEVLEDLEAAFDQLRSMDRVTTEDVRRFHGALVGGRRLDRANALAQESGIGDDLPPMVVRMDAAEGPRIIRFTSEETAVVEPWQDRGLALLMTAHPGCGFSRRALAAIRQDGALSQWVAAHGVLLAPQDLTGDLRVYSRWALGNADLPVRIAYRRDDFGSIDSWATPNFYVLKDGEVIARLEGWPKGRTTASVRQLLQTAGVRIP
jgi:hypothetical protein